MTTTETVSTPTTTTASRRRGPASAYPEVPVEARKGLREAVRRGAMLLDRSMPGWFRKLSTRALRSNEPSVVQHMTDRLIGTRDRKAGHFSVYTRLTQVTGRGPKPRLVDGGSFPTEIDGGYYGLYPSSEHAGNLGSYDQAEQLQADAWAAEVTARRG
jgi:hypothetical protein